MDGREARYALCVPRVCGTHAIRRHSVSTRTDMEELCMKSRRILIVVFIALIALVPSLAVFADGPPAQHTRTQMYTHPSQGPVTLVEGSTAHLRSNDQGVTIVARTHDLVPGNVHTFWIVTVNRPDLCDVSPCSINDLVNRTDEIEGNTVYGGGRVVRSHTTHFQAHLRTGEVAGGWSDNAFTSPRTAEIHVIINDHGPMIPGLTREMTRTYRAGCTDESIPSAFPPRAFADGTPGPNTCRLVQFGIFVQ